MKQRFACLLVVAALGCGLPAQKFENFLPVIHEPADAGDGGNDAGATPPFDAGVRLVVPHANTLPLTEADVLRLGTGSSIDIMAALVELPGTKAQLYYESSNEDFT